MYCGDLCPVRDVKDSTGDPNEEKLVISEAGTDIYRESNLC